MRIVLLNEQGIRCATIESQKVDIAISALDKLMLKAFDKIFGKIIGYIIYP